jgi:VWFA-related protein
VVGILKNDLKDSTPALYGHTSGWAMMRAEVDMTVPPFVLALALLAAGHIGSPHPGQDPAQPLKSGVELVMVDTQVVDRKGTPIEGLTAQQFEVKIGGKRRAVVSAQLLESSTGFPRGAEAGGKPISSPGNIYVLAVDQGSFRAVNAAAVVHAAREFLKRANPNDYIGMVSFPAPGVVIDPTRDRAELQAAIPRLVGFSGLKQMRQFQYSLSDAIDVAARDAEALDRVVQRNCPVPSDLACRRSVEMELYETVSLLEMQAARSLAGLRDVVASVRDMPARKTVVVLSAGIPSGDRSGARMYMRSDATQAGKEAAAAGILLYTLHLNTAFLDSFSPDAPSLQQTVMRETGVYTKALDTFNGAAGGTLLEVNTGADFAIDRLMRETAAFYLLGVEVQEADRTGQPQRIEVKVNQRGANVRNRAMVTIPKKN